MINTGRNLVGVRQDILKINNYFGFSHLIIDALDKAKCVYISGLWCVQLNSGG